MNKNDFDRLKESVRQMVSIKAGEEPASRRFKYAGKVLVEIEENGETVWHIEDAARALREAIVEGDVEIPNTPGGCIRMMREVLRQTQEGFAELLSVPTSTLRNWEQGRREPDAPATKLISVISRHPDALLDSVRENNGFELACY